VAEADGEDAAPAQDRVQARARRVPGRSGPAVDAAEGDAQEPAFIIVPIPHRDPFRKMPGVGIDPPGHFFLIGAAVSRIKGGSVQNFPHMGKLFPTDAFHGDPPEAIRREIFVRKQMHWNPIAGWYRTCFLFDHGMTQHFGGDDNGNELFTQYIDILAGDGKEGQMGVFPPRMRPSFLHPFYRSRRWQGLFRFLGGRSRYDVAVQRESPAAHAVSWDERADDHVGQGVYQARRSVDLRIPGPLFHPGGEHQAFGLRGEGDDRTRQVLKIPRPPYFPPTSRNAPGVSPAAM